MSFVGKQYGNYQLLSLLGSGGFADVYLGEHIYLGSQAAIKVLSTRLSSQDRDAFQSEARLLVKLSHPFIVRLLDFGITADDGMPYLVMDYAPNGSLRKRHPSGTIIPLPTIIAYIQQIGEALQYAHDQRLIHRDIKPENMLLGKNNEVLLSDFGIALQAASTINQSLQDVAGTAAYMAPEQLQGKPRAASDQYALGVIVYEWLCGTYPFAGTFLEIASQHLMVDPPPMREKNPTIPPEIEHVVMTALTKDPQRRFTNIRAFVNALRQAVPHASPSPSWPGLSDMPTYIVPSDYRPGFTPLPPSAMPSQPGLDTPTATPRHLQTPVQSPISSGTTVAESALPNTIAAANPPSFSAEKQEATSSQTTQASSIPRRAFMIGGLITLGIVGTASGATYVLLNNGSMQPKKKLPTIVRPVSSDGSMFGMDSQHTRVVPSEHKLNVSNVKNLQISWQRYLGGAISISSPTIVDGIIYVGSTNSHLYAIRASDGTIVWEFRADNEIFSSPAVAGNGIFFGSNDKRIYGITKQSELVWQFSVGDGVPGSPVIANGVLYIGSSDFSLYALEATSGKKLWAKRTGSGITSSPAVVNNRVYVGSFDQFVYALDASTGQEIWKTLTDGGIFSSPAVADGIVYVGGHDNYIYALDAQNGQKRWRVKTDNQINSSPAIWNNTIFIGSKDSNLYAIDRGGTVLWKKATQAEIASSPTIANGVLYIGSWDHYLYALDPANQGKELWKSETLDGIESSPAVFDGAVYVGSRDGNLYAYSLPS